MRRRATLFAWMAASLLTAARAKAEQNWKVVGSDRMGVAVLENGEPLFKLGVQVNGPQFVRCKLTELPAIADGTRRYAQTIAFHKAMFSVIVARPRYLIGMQSVVSLSGHRGPATVSDWNAKCCEFEVAVLGAYGLISSLESLSGRLGTLVL